MCVCVRFALPKVSVYISVTVWISQLLPSVAADKYILDFGTNSRLHATGRVQVYQSGVFGYVCDDQWTAKDASVVGYILEIQKLDEM